MTGLEGCATMLMWAVTAGEPELVRRPVPKPSPDQALIAVRFSGICGSDLAKLAPRQPRIPAPPGWCPGHEVGGVDVSSLTHRLAAVNPLVPCQRCSNCIAGAIHLCAGLCRIGSDIPGGFAEFLLVPRANLELLPTRCDPANAVLADPLAVAIHGLECGLRGLRPGRLGILGSGAIGVCTSAYAALRGWEVFLVAGSIGHARDLEHVLDASVLPNVATLPACDAVIDAASGRDGQPIRQAVEAVRDGGSILVQNAYGPDVSLGLPIREVFGRSLTLTGSYGFCRSRGRDDFREAIEILSTNPPWARVLTQTRYSLTSLPMALAALNSGAISRPSKVVLTVG